VELTGRGFYGKNTKVYTQESYWLWETALNFAVKEDCSAFVKVNNLTNQDYEEAAGTYGAYYPMPGRNYLFGVNLKF